MNTGHLRVQRLRSAVPARLVRLPRLAPLPQLTRPSRLIRSPWLARTPRPIPPAPAPVGSPASGARRTVLVVGAVLLVTAPAVLPALVPGVLPAGLRPTAFAAAPTDTPHGATPAPTPNPAPAPASVPAPAPAPAPAVRLGFDTCAAPALRTMAAWRASPFRTVGIYVGGANRGCPDGNLSASWVRKVSGYGYSFIPTYVGRQAPCTDKTWATIDATWAAAQGGADAVDAVNRLRALGFGPGNPVYLDIEHYENDAEGADRCGAAVVRYVTGWVRRLHAAGYRAGVYGNTSSGIRDLARARGSRGVTLPDAIWIAQWDDVASVWDNPHLSNGLWAFHQRVKQFRGDHVETHGGVSLSIDSNVVDGPVAAPDGAPTDPDTPGTPDTPDTPPASTPPGAPNAATPPMPPGAATGAATA